MYVGMSGIAEANFDWSGTLGFSMRGKRVRADARPLAAIIGPVAAGSAGPVLLTLDHRRWLLSALGSLGMGRYTSVNVHAITRLPFACSKSVRCLV